jgi:hypothetical protein
MNCNKPFDVTVRQCHLKSSRHSRGALRRDRAALSAMRLPKQSANVPVWLATTGADRDRRRVMPERLQ